MNHYKHNPWLKLATVPEQAEWSLICLPFAGGYAEYFLPWQHRLTNGALVPIQLPARSYRWQEQAITSMDELIEQLIPEIVPIITQRPYVFFGHSMGGVYCLCIGKEIA